MRGQRSPRPARLGRPRRPAGARARFLGELREHPPPPRPGPLGLVGRAGLLPFPACITDRGQVLLISAGFANLDFGVGLSPA